MESNERRAKSQDERPCPKCKGTGTVTVERKSGGRVKPAVRRCPGCGGKKIVKGGMVTK